MPSSATCWLCNSSDQDPALELFPESEEEDQIGRSSGLCAKCQRLSDDERRALVAMSLRNTCIEMLVDHGLPRSVASACVAKNFPSDPREMIELETALILHLDTVRQDLVGYMVVLDYWRATCTSAVIMALRLLESATRPLTGLTIRKGSSIAHGPSGSGFPMRWRLITMRRLVVLETGHSYGPNKDFEPFRLHN